MVDEIKDFFLDYYNQLVMWYEGLDQVSQYGLAFITLVAAFAVIVFFMLIRITK
ncbi:MAG: hypothetical protein JXC33_12840 [Deltaproteobacteria bacterium]|nr:hypothetical protein [Deltaproteobacteria bacterium]